MAQSPQHQRTGLSRHAALVLALAASVAAGAATWAQSANATEVPYPREFRTWQHVKSIVVGPEHASFPKRGGFHHYYANEPALEGYRTGTFPDGSVIVDEGVSATDGTGQAKGIVLEGARRSLDVMVKSDQRYKDTGGWGFEHFDGDSVIGALPADGRRTCFACHSNATHDHVFSTIRK